MKTAATRSNTITLSTQLSHRSETGLLTLYCRSMESHSADPILKDEKAIEAANRLRLVLAASDQESLRRRA